MLVRPSGTERSLGARRTACCTRQRSGSRSVMAASFARRGSRDTRETPQSASARHAPPASFLAVVVCALATWAPRLRGRAQRGNGNARTARAISPAAPLGRGAGYRITPPVLPRAVFRRSFSVDDGLPRDRPPTRPSAAGAARRPTVHCPRRPRSAAGAPARRCAGSDRPGASGWRRCAASDCVPAPGRAAGRTMRNVAVPGRAADRASDLLARGLQDARRDVARAGVDAPAGSGARTGEGRRPEPLEGRP